MKVSSLQLRDGTTIPAVGLGSWMGEVGGGSRVYEMCRKGLKLGYRHFDTASSYGNEEMVGKAIRDSGIPRSSIYITTKLSMNSGGKVRETFEQSLRNLDCEYIDLYLVHWPQAGSYTEDGKIRGPSEGYPELINVWKEMEKLIDTGKVKSIGVSNFSIKTLSVLLPHCKEDLKSFCEEKGILVTAYSPLGQASTVFFESPIINGIADKHHVTPAQVVLSWCVQRGTIVIPKSENEQRLLANITLIHLPEEDISAVNNLHRQPGMHKGLLPYHQPDGTVFGWTYDQLGWNMTVGGVVLQ